jgi:hypothetical protein
MKADFNKFRQGGPHIYVPLHSRCLLNKTGDGAGALSAPNGGCEVVSGVR